MLVIADSIQVVIREAVSPEIVNFAYSNTSPQQDDPTGINAAIIHNLMLAGEQRKVNELRRNLQTLQALQTATRC